MAQIYEEFGVARPWWYDLIIRWFSISDVTTVAVWIGLILVGCAWIFWSNRSSALTTRNRWGLPTITRLRQLGRLATFSDVLALLIDNSTPLDEAVVLAAEASGDRHLSGASLVLAEQIRRGNGGADLPPGVPPLLGWMLTSQTPPQHLVRSLRQAADSYRRRALRMGSWLTVYLPILLAAIIGGTITGGCLSGCHCSLLSSSLPVELLISRFPGRALEQGLCMSTFHFTASDAQSRKIHGEVVATDESAARQELMARGLTLIEISAATDIKPPSRLSAREAEQVVVALAEVSRSELPLAAGLRAAAQECTSRRVASALRQIAAQVEQGYALESILKEHGRFLPPHVRGLVVAAARSRRLGVALDELVEHHRAIREAWSEVLSALAYPAIVLGTAFAVIMGLLLFIVPTFDKMFLEFQLQLPAPTRVLVGLGSVALGLNTKAGVFFGVCTVLGIAIFCFAASSGWGTTWTQRLANHMPLVGKMWWWSNSAAWTRLLATLLDQNVALPEALDLVSNGVRDPLSRQTVRWLARGTEQGLRLSDLLASGVHLPASVLPFVRWGETTGQLPTALRNVSEMLLARLHSRAKVLYSVAPSLVFLLVGFVVGFTVIALFMPLVSLIQGLT